MIIDKIFTNEYSEKIGELLQYIITASAVFVIFLSIYFIFTRILKKIEKRSEFTIITRIRKLFRTPLILLMLIISVVLPATFFEISETLTNPAGKIMVLSTIALFSWILIRVVGLFKFLVLKQYDLDQKDNLKARKVYTQFRIIERILVFVIIVIAIALSLMTFDGIRKIGISLIASAGVTGIILGLAAQKIIGSVLAGFQLALTQPIRIDDVVVVENEWGRIEEINLTYVVVQIWDKRRLILPTTYFIEHPFQNWTRTSAEILGTVFIYTDYTVPFDALRNELTRLLNITELWDKKVNVLQVTNATEKTVEIRALMSAADSSTAWNLRVYIRENIILFLQKNYPESLPKSRVVIIPESSEKKDK
ncbi:MAG: mechanosensitive ion channel [Bacteroidales bacterium]|nr:mechanosensitive ion channel [Bacteroidales bacterium]